MTISRNLSFLAEGASSTGVLGVPNGGSGAVTLTGYLIGNGTGAFTASATIPTSALSGTVSLTTQVSGILPIANGGSAQSSFTAGYVHFGSFSTDSNFFWDNTNKRLGIGTVSPSVSLEVNGGGKFGTGTLGYALLGNTSGYPIVLTGRASDSFAYIKSLTGAGAVAGSYGFNSTGRFDVNMGASETLAVTIFTSGGVSIGNTTDPGAGNLRFATTGTNGIYFGSSARLDDYETGTWTPVVTASTGSITSYTASGTYTKVGRLVVATFTYNITNNGTGTGLILVTAPFTAGSAALYPTGSAAEVAIAGWGGYCIIAQSTASIGVQQYSGAYAGLTGVIVRGTISYQV